ncbi:MAG: hypothetical protein QOK16_638 [Solirubrobacteraceae bacterium]|jgi:hypothetical protein|nr:hypothetical protein [Solirubrobacteraceae bacterium]MEA2184755.1 hypothetical protein [Solirubrobacteraceae bacterium]MEA2185627.1 hypothetical protein [Solirubrobacteraceae bacterium]
MPHILVVANQTIGGAKLLNLVQERAQAPDTSFTLVVPMTRPRSGYVIYDEAVRESAQVRLDLTLSYLRGEDVVASGELGDEDPYTATLDAIDEYHPDEVIISTLPQSSSGWLRRDLIERIQDAAAAPVTHVISDMDAEGLPFKVTLVIANVTAGRGTLRARMKEIAADSKDMLFLVIVPLQAHGDGRAAAVARARLGNTVDRMRREGLLVAGMIGDPDPYTATMNALQFYRVERVIISTLPATRSGWMRADLISRVRKASNIEVEHIVAERDGAEAAR